MPMHPQMPEVPLDHPIRVFLVDDQPIIRRGLSALLGNEPDLQICGEAGQADEALSKISHLQPDLAVVDLFLEEGDTFALIAELRGRLPDLGILVFSMYRDPFCVVRAMRAGADNFIPKDEGAEMVVRTIREIIRDRNSKRPAVGNGNGSSASKINLGDSPIQSSDEPRLNENAPSRITEPVKMITRPEFS